MPAEKTIMKEKKDEAELVREQAWKTIRNLKISKV